MTSEAGVPGAPRFEVVRRGYDRRQVDEHVARLQRVIARMRADLTARSQYGPHPGEMSAYGPQHPHPPQSDAGPRLDPAQQPGESQDAIGGFTDRMQSILQAAEEEAEEIRNRARAAARVEIEDLGRQRDAMLSELSEVRKQLEGLLSGQTARLNRADLGGQVAPGAGPQPGAPRPGGVPPTEPQRGPAPRPRPRPHPSSTAAADESSPRQDAPRTGTSGTPRPPSAGPSTDRPAPAADGGANPAGPPASPDAPPAQRPTSQARVGDAAAGSPGGIAAALRPRDGAGPDTGVLFRTPRAEPADGKDGRKADGPQPAEPPTPPPAAPGGGAVEDAPTSLVSMVRPSKPVAGSPNGTSGGEDTVVVKVQPAATGRPEPSAPTAPTAPTRESKDEDGTADTVEVTGNGRSTSGSRSG